jgi:multidrug resistance efflux pump
LNGAMKRRIPREISQDKRYHLRHLIPVTVWLAAVAAVIWLFHERTERFEAIGIARSPVREIAANCTGRIQDVPVELFQPVKAGQTVAVVNTLLDNEQTLEAELKTRLGTVTAEIEHLSAQLIPTQETLLSEASNLEMNRASDERRFSMDVENARLKILGLQATIASDQIMADDLATEVKIVEKLLADGAVAAYELDKAKLQYEGMASRIRENEQLLDQAKTDLKEAENRRDQFAQKELKHPSVDYAMEVIRKEIGVQEEVMNGLLRQLDALRSRRAVALTSPIDGVVIPIPLEGRGADRLSQRPGERVIRRAGEVVTAGDTILAIAQETPTEIIAYVGEQATAHLRKNMPVKLVKIQEQAQIGEGRIVAIGPMVELTPQRLWRSPTIPQWGLPVVISIPPGLKLIPGETVGVRGL